MNINENEFHAEAYMGSLKEQQQDAEKDIILLAVETAQRIKPFVVDVEDLNYKLQKLKQLREAIKDNDLPIVAETTETILRIVNNDIGNTKSEIQIKSFEIKQICEVM